MLSRRHVRISYHLPPTTFHQNAQKLLIQPIFYIPIIPNSICDLQDPPGSAKITLLTLRWMSEAMNPSKS